MGLFGSKNKRESVVLVDVSADSVAGAYAAYVDGQPPAILYTKRLPVEIRVDEKKESAVLRAVQTLADTLVREGAPALMRATGSGRAETIFLSLDAPWQKTFIQTENVERDTPFVFTKGVVADILKKVSEKAPKGTLVDERVMGIILNGYETREPYGKKAHRATVLILASLIDGPVTKSISSVLQSAYHTKHILPVASASLRCQSLQKSFPHERDALIFDVIGSRMSIALLRKGLFVSITEVGGAESADRWIQSVGSELAELAKRYPLPPTIFLLARESEVVSLRQTLDAANLGKLWLSDNPPKMVSVLASHIAGLVRQATVAPPDLSLSLMALHYQTQQAKHS